MKSRAVAKLMGRVFIEQAALNLLGSVLDTPGGWLGGLACAGLVASTLAPVLGRD